MERHPAFAGARDLVPLSGFSGAHIGLLRDAGGRTFVRKAAQEPHDSTRLRRQAERQSLLSAQIERCASVPAILRDGEAEGCYWFDMEYVIGRDGVTWLGHATISQFGNFAEAVTSVIERLAATPHTGASFDPAAAVRTKLLEIDTRCAGEYGATLAPLVAIADTLSATLSPTATHGDLTLENIMVDGTGQLWLIDTIDSPFDHYWVDLSKLFQDCEGRWFLHRGRSLPLGTSWELRQRLMAAATRLDARYPAFHHLLLALNFARILPYARSDQDRAFILDRIATFAAISDRSLTP